MKFTKLLEQLSVAPTEGGYGVELGTDPLSGARIEKHYFLVGGQKQLTKDTLWYQKTPSVITKQLDAASEAIKKASLRKDFYKDFDTSTLDIVAGLVDGRPRVTATSDNGQLQLWWDGTTFRMKK